MFKPASRIVDIPFSIVLIISFSIWAGAIYLYSHLFRLAKANKSKKKILFFVPTIYAELEKKGVLWMIEDREERGYFDFVYTIHPFVSPTRTILISDKNVIIEYGADRYDRLGSLGLKLTQYVLTLWSLISFSINLIRRENIAIVRSNGPYLTGLIGLACSKLTNIPFCISLHTDYDLMERIGTELAPGFLGSRKLAKKLRRFVLSHTRMVMPIRDSLAHYAIKNGAKPESIRVIPHGIDPSPFLKSPDPKIRKGLGIEGKKVVSFVGRLSKGNYSADAVEIASEVCRQRQDVAFLMVGDGRERAYLEGLIQNYGLNNNIKFLGFQPRTRVAQIRLISDVSLCLMAGLSLIEAAAAGTPLVSYDVDWHYELVRDSETGFLLPEGDIQGAANAVIRLLDNSELSKRLGENARRLAMERHSLENTSKVKIKWYEELISD